MQRDPNMAALVTIIYRSHIRHRDHSSIDHCGWLTSFGKYASIFHRRSAGVNLQYPSLALPVTDIDLMNT